MDTKRKIAIAVLAVGIIAILTFIGIRIFGNQEEEASYYKMSEFQETIMEAKVPQDLEYSAEYTLDITYADGKTYPVQMSVNHLNWFYDDGNMINSKSKIVMIGIDIKNEMHLPLIYDIVPKVYYPGSKTDSAMSKAGLVVDAHMIKNDLVVEENRLNPGQSGTLWVTAIVPMNVDAARIEPINGITVTVDLARK